MKKLIVFVISSFLLFLAANLSVVRAQLVVPPYIISDNATGGDCELYLIGDWDVGTNTCTLNKNVGGGIQIVSSRITLDGNGKTLTGTPSGDGVDIEDVSNIIVKNLTIKNSINGILAYYSDGNNLDNITISDNKTGIYLLNSSGNTLQNNVLSNNSDYGISFGSSSGNTVTGNTISNCGRALYLTVSNSNTIYGNNISNNILGINFPYGQNSTGNKIYRNNFMGNSTQANDLSSGGANIYNLTVPEGDGNYWSNWTSPDNNHDGFVDNPYNFPSGGVDWFPHVCPIGTTQGSDETPPVTTAGLSGTSGNNGWYKSNVLVTLNATDAGGACGGGGTVASTKYSYDGTNWTTYTSPFTVNNEGSITVYFYSTDSAGNDESTKSQLVKIDKTPPTISGAATISPNANGWYKNNVTIHFTASDGVSGSGIDTLTPDVTLTTEGTNQFAGGIAIDKAGNSASVTVSGINIDKTLPQITLTTPTGGAVYLLNQNVLANWTVTDSISGIAASSSGTVASGQKIDTASVGTKNFTVVATDNAGNQNSQTHSYNVGYSYSGVLWPINGDGSSVFGLGWIIPVRFRLRDANGGFVSNANTRLYLAKVTNGQVGTEIEAVSALPRIFPGNAFIYDQSLREYDFFMATRSLSRGIWQLRIALDDGTSKTVNITLR